MANTIRLKRSAVAGKVPTTAQLSLGELAVNTRDGRLFLKKNNGTEEIIEFVSSEILHGAVVFFAMTTAPTGWLKCNGAAISRTTYAALFSAIGTTFGVGNGSTTFNLPDLRGEFLRAWDDGRGVDSGRAHGTFQQGSSHYFENSGFEINGDNNIRDWDGTYNGSFVNTVKLDGGAVILSPVKTWAYSRPRNISLLACIKY